jgi:hypothetical protein
MSMRPEVAACLLAITEAGDVVGFASPDSDESVNLLRDSARHNALNLRVGVSIVRLEIPLPLTADRAAVTEIERVDAP